MIWQRLKQPLWHWRGVLVTVPVVSLVVFAARSLGLLQQLELLALDQFFLLRPQEPIENRIVIVEIDEADIQKQARWPMSDAVLTQLLDNIRQQQPVAIGLDIYRDLQVEPGHAQLVELFKTTPNLIGVQKVVASDDSAAVKPPPVLQELGQVGGNDLVLDPDGKIRRSLMYLTDPQTGENVFSLGLILGALYLQQQHGIEPEFSETMVQFGSVQWPRLRANDGGYMRADAGGFQTMLNYRGELAQFPHVSMTDVLENRVPPDLMRDRIVLVGATAESLKDLFYTPFSSSLTTPRRTAGVVIHANIASQIISATLDGRPVLRACNTWQEWLWIVGCTLVGAVISWQQRYLKRPWNLVGFLGMGLAAGTVVAISYGAFLSGWWLPVVPPVMGLVGAALAITGYIARSAADMRRTFGRYLTDEVVARLLETPAGQKLGGERRKVTILVSDLRGFSAISERLPPEQVVTILNNYLAVMSDVISQYQGTINEFIGDGIFVLFGAPVYRSDDAQRAIACAIAMQDAMTTVNEQNHALGFPSLEMGIGLNTGEVVVGNIGSQKRAKYTVIGSHANLAARVETYTVGGQILISEHTLADAGVALDISGDMLVEPKGIRDPVTLYEVQAIQGKYAIALPAAVEDFVPLAPAVSVHYSVLEGKHEVGTVFEGKLMQLSELGADLWSENLPTHLSNLKLMIPATAETELVEDIYAKVLEKPADRDDCVRIRFTSLMPEAITVLEHLRG